MEVKNNNRTYIFLISLALTAIVLLVVYLYMPNLLIDFDYFYKKLTSLLIIETNQVSILVKKFFSDIWSCLKDSQDLNIFFDKFS